MRVRPVPGTVLVLALCLLGCGTRGGEKPVGPASRVAVIGFDGATLDLIQPLIADGSLPHFQKLTKEGVWGELTTVIPPASPPAWTSASTGVNPGKHGIFTFMQEVSRGEDGDLRLRFCTSRDRRAQPVWGYLSNLGHRVVVVNVPLTCPADSVAGVMISGFPYPRGARVCFPDDLLRNYPQYRPDNYGIVCRPGHEQEFLDDLYEIFENRLDTVLDLMREERWDLLWVTFTLADRVSHYFWKFMDPNHPLYDPEEAERFGDAIVDAYRAADRALGEVLARLDEETLILVMSDHGFGPLYYGVNSSKLFSEELSSDVAPWVLAADRFGGKFAILTAEEDSQTERLERRQKLRSLLDTYRDPATGVPVVLATFAREEIYKGPYTDQAPDLMSLEEDGYLFYNWVEDPRRSVVEPLDPHLFSGFHRMNGLFMAKGPGVLEGSALEGTRIVDIAPTILWALGEQIPSCMDGRVPFGAFTEEILEEFPLQLSDATGAEGVGGGEICPLPSGAAAGDSSLGVVSPEVREQLRTLGYLR